MKSMQQFERMLEPGDVITIGEGDREVALTHFMHAENGPFNATMDLWANDDLSIQLSHTIFEHHTRQFRYVMMHSKKGTIPKEVGDILIELFLPDELVVDGAYMETGFDMPPALVLSNVVSTIKPGLVRPGSD